MVYGEGAPAARRNARFTLPAETGRKANEG
jgi:hypothetical protein